MSLHIHRVPTDEVSRHPTKHPRWCFRCRRVCGFEIVVTAAVWPALNWYWPTEQELIDTAPWYGPNVQIECSVCHLIDGDLFPGRYREWEE